MPWYTLVPASSDTFVITRQDACAILKSQCPSLFDFFSSVFQAATDRVNPTMFPAERKTNCFIVLQPWIRPSPARFTPPVQVSPSSPPYPLKPVHWAVQTNTLGNDISPPKSNVPLFMNDVDPVWKETAPIVYRAREKTLEVGQQDSTILYERHSPANNKTLTPSRLLSVSDL